MARTKITEESSRAFRDQRRFRRSNTAVVNEPDGSTTMRLFGNLVARYTPRENKLWINTCGRNTVTTKERLNGILEKFNAGHIYQKNYEWYYMDKNGNVFTMPIHNCMIIDLNDYQGFTFINI